MSFSHHSFDKMLCDNAAACHMYCYPSEELHLPASASTLQKEISVPSGFILMNSLRI